MPDQPALTVVGGGKMGEALAVGLVRQGWEPVVVEADPRRRADLADRHPEWTVSAASGAASEAVIAVKPADVEAACAQLQDPTRVLSIAAGVTIASLESWLPAKTAVIRAMPNTPALIGAGAAAIAAGAHAGPGDVAWARGILEAVGTVVDLDEAALDAVTGLSGSGPAYVFLVAEALIDAGVLVGLTRPVAKQLTVQTLLGAAQLMADTADEPSVLRAAVTSPGGTTAAGLRALEAAGVRNAILDAVAEATERSRQLGRQQT
jgi:pyrroline-5-carboxylate reductase